MVFPPVAFGYTLYPFMLLTKNYLYVLYFILKLSSIAPLWQRAPKELFTVNKGSRNLSHVFTDEFILFVAF